MLEQTASHSTTDQAALRVHAETITSTPRTRTCVIKLIVERKPERKLPREPCRNLAMAWFASAALAARQLHSSCACIYKKSNRRRKNKLSRQTTGSGPRAQLLAIKGGSCVLSLKLIWRELHSLIHEANICLQPLVPLSGEPLEMNQACKN